VEAVDEFEAEGDKEGYPQQNVGEDAGLVDRGEVDRKPGHNVDETADEDEGEDGEAPFRRRIVFELLIKDGCLCRSSCRHRVAVSPGRDAVTLREI